MAIIEFCEVTMAYGGRSDGRQALRRVSMTIDEGSLALLVGPSGSGKSTLLKLILAMERPAQGTIRVAGRDIHRLRQASIPYLRRNVGVVFQDFKLLLDASPLRNVGLALEVLGLPRAEVDRRARLALNQVEIDSAISRPVRCMSGGEQQRVAIARALAGEPAILLADEPSGNLDPRLTREILELLQRISRAGTTVVLATHDPLVQSHLVADQILQLQNGCLVTDARAAAPSCTAAVGGPIQGIHALVGAVA